MRNKDIFIFPTLLLILSSLLLSVLFNSCHSRRILRSLKSEMERYPESTLGDIYKSWFQSVYGPGHLLTDSAGAVHYLNAELAQTNDYNDTTYWCPLGMNGRFGRLNLYVVASGKVPREEYIAAFIESGKQFALPEIKEWRKEWNRVLSVMDKDGLKPDNFEKDRQTIDSLLMNNEYVFHHSNKYTQAYDPHYRVVSTAAYTKLKKKYFK